MSTAVAAPPLQKTDGEMKASTDGGMENGDVRSPAAARYVATIAAPATFGF